LLFLLLAISLACVDDARGDGSETLTGMTMGTTYTVRVSRMPPALGAVALQAGIERVLASIDRQMSTYRPDSEISRFNACQSTDWIEVSPDTVRVVAAALHTSRLSHGAFDATVATLVDLWGFGAARRTDQTPAAESIEAARAFVGYSNVEVRRKPPALRKQQTAIRIDLSAIAKGFGVDKVAEHLERIGVGDYLVEIGGEIKGHGRNTHGQSWTVAVELPGPELLTSATIVRLEDAAIATSGDYRNFFDRDGERYSHIIDPRSGAPIRHSLASVAVIDRSAMRADGLATALLVMGPDDGLRLASEKNLAALFIVRQQEGFSELRTAAFQRLEMH
jgi:thiamine biosynthesis lipoprotein